MTTEKKLPHWVTHRGGIDEHAFCQAFMNKHYLVCYKGVFFSPEGRLDPFTVRQMIFEEMKEYICSNIARKVDCCLSTLRYVASREAMEEDLSQTLMTVHAANGEYLLSEGRLSPVKQLTRFRLAVDYNPDAPRPEKWLKFLSELLHEEDIPTLQEYMGYCLIPCTLGQKMLLITGRGGEGKSRIGVVMKALLGHTLCLGSIAKVEKSPFARADLEHMLVMVDDDLKMEAMDQTNYLKSIITAELPMDLERKGEQSFQGELFVRFLAFGNGSLQALHDRSHGFFRRQIILEAKERAPGRKDDPYLGWSLQQEKEGILLWCIEGLERLIVQDFKFTMSRRARENLLRSMAQSNNIPEFLRSEGYITFREDAEVTSKALYECYQKWCMDNVHVPLRPSTFWAFLNQNLQTYQITPTRSILIGNEKYARGYKGIALRSVM